MFEMRLARLCRRGEAAGSAGRGAPTQRVFPRLPCSWGDSMPAFLARHYGVPTEVERRDDEPAVFLWRGRRHVVREVLAHWWQTGAWWERLDSGLDDDEREIWRVEAVAAGRSPVVVELGFSWSTATWSVVAVLD